MGAMMRSDTVLDIMARCCRYTLRVDRSPGVDRWVVRRDGGDVFDGTREQVAIFLLGASHGRHRVEDEVKTLRAAVDAAFAALEERTRPLERP